MNYHFTAVLANCDEAESLESAIRSAVADVQKAGCTVKHTIVESPEPVA